MADQWTYHVIGENFPMGPEAERRAAEMLMRWGQQGWELVAAVCDPTGRSRILYMLKMRVTDVAKG